MLMFICLFCFCLFQANCFSVEDNVLNIYWLMKIVETQEQTVSISQGLTKKFFLHLKGSGDSIILFVFVMHERFISNLQKKFSIQIATTYMQQRLLSLGIINGVLIQIETNLT